MKPQPLERMIGQLLVEYGQKVVFAESCTGGLIGHRITNIPGSSEYYLGSITAYAYEAKVHWLDVSWDTLEAHGAVSRAVVLEMARGVRKALKADIGMSVSGIAGPGGGLPEKPVGTTWIGLATAQGAWARRFCWDGDRLQNKTYSADAVLQMLLDYLHGERALDRK
ncbi:MAG: CinA family protein [Anaerolineales bacterium]|nr:CinA family protein [Anaerolineales bacterium]